MDVRKFGFTRVSSKDQNEGRQLEAIKKLGVDPHVIFFGQTKWKRFQSGSVPITKACGR